VLYWITGTVLQATPLAATVTASATPHALAASATDASGNALPDPSAFVTWSSSNPTDVFSSAGVVMTQVGTRTITATWNGDAGTSSSFPVQVLEGPLVGFTFVSPDAENRTVAPGTQVQFEVEGVDAFGNTHGDATEAVSYSSNVASDVFSATDPNEVTVTTPGPHVFTASYPGYASATVTITVTAGSQNLGTTPPPAGGGQNRGSTSGNPVPDAPTSTLASTGESIPVWPLLAALAALILGVSLTLRIRSRRSTPRTRS
jgi:LPXTG-motif cell wall-anchored protein